MSKYDCPLDNPQIQELIGDDARFIEQYKAFWARKQAKRAENERITAYNDQMMIKWRQVVAESTFDETYSLRAYLTKLYAQPACFERMSNLDTTIIDTTLNPNKPKTFTPRKSNPRKFEASARRALKHGDEDDDVVGRFGVENTLEASISLIDEQVEAQIQLGVAYEQNQKTKGEQLNKAIVAALNNYQLKLLNETNWKAPGELTSLMEQIELNEKSIIAHAKKELEIENEDDEEKNRGELIVRWFMATVRKSACSKAFDLLNESQPEETETHQAYEDVKDEVKAKQDTIGELISSPPNVAPELERISACVDDLNALVNVKMPTKVAELEALRVEHGVLRDSVGETLKSLKPSPWSKLTSQELLQLESSGLVAPSMIELEPSQCRAMGEFNALLQQITTDREKMARTIEKTNHVNQKAVAQLKTRLTCEGENVRNVPTLLKEADQFFTAYEKSRASLAKFAKLNF